MRAAKWAPHFTGLGWHPWSLLWPASGSGLDMIWKLECQLRHIKWGLILKLSSMPFLSHCWNHLRGFFRISSSPTGLCKMYFARFFSQVPASPAESGLCCAKFLEGTAQQDHWSRILPHEPLSVSLWLSSKERPHPWDIVLNRYHKSFFFMLEHPGL